MRFIQPRRTVMNRIPVETTTMDDGAAEDPKPG
jgi:hypothetical protein